MVAKLREGIALYGRQIDLACRSLTVALDMLLGNYLIHLQGQVSGREIRFHNGRTVTCV